MPGGMSAYELLLLMSLSTGAWLVFIFKKACQIKQEAIIKGRDVGVGIDPRVRFLVRLAGASTLALSWFAASPA